MSDPLGIRQNNPGNLRPTTPPWLGEIPSGNGYCKFIMPENGIRAMGKTLLVYQSKHQCKTISAIIGRWAPPSDNNDTPAYIAAVSADVGIDADRLIDLTDASVLSSVLAAIIQHENGQQPYAMVILERAASAAVGDGLDW